MWIYLVLLMIALAAIVWTSVQFKRKTQEELKREKLYEWYIVVLTLASFIFVTCIWRIWSLRQESMDMENLSFTSFQIMRAWVYHPETNERFSIDIPPGMTAQHFYEIVQHTLQIHEPFEIKYQTTDGQTHILEMSSNQTISSIYVHHPNIMAWTVEVSKNCRSRPSTWFQEYLEASDALESTENFERVLKNLPDMYREKFLSYLFLLHDNTGRLEEDTAHDIYDVDGIFELIGKGPVHLQKLWSPVLAILSQPEKVKVLKQSLQPSEWNKILKPALMILGATNRIDKDFYYLLNEYNESMSDSSEKSWLERLGSQLTQSRIDEDTIRQNTSEYPKKLRKSIQDLWFPRTTSRTSLSISQ